MFTQGIWEKVENTAIRVDMSNDNQCLLFGDDAESNAALIAAAPELLTACKALVNTSPDYADHWLRATKDAERAIAKAENS